MLTPTCFSSTEFHVHHLLKTSTIGAVHILKNRSSCSLSARPAIFARIIPITMTLNLHALLAHVEYLKLSYRHATDSSTWPKINRLCAWAKHLCFKLYGSQFITINSHYATHFTLMQASIRISSRGHNFRDGVFHWFDCETSTENSKQQVCMSSLCISKSNFQRHCQKPHVCRLDYKFT